MEKGGRGGKSWVQSQPLPPFKIDRSLNNLGHNLTIVTTYAQKFHGNGASQLEPGAQEGFKTPFHCKNYKK